MHRVVLLALSLALGQNAMAAPAPVQATQDSRLVQRVLAMPIAGDDVFLIDDTLRYLGLVEESDLFRRHIKRLEYSRRVTGIEPDRTLTAKEAIARERGESVESLLRLHEAWYAKNIVVGLLPVDETPYQARDAKMWVQVAPSLWGAGHWENPGSYSPYYFGVKVTYREALDFTDAPPPPELKVVMDDGRTLELQCAFSLSDFVHAKAVLDWCGGRKRQKLDREIVAMARDLAAGKGHLDVHFTQTALVENNLWFKSAQRDGIDARAWKLIQASSCIERNDCLRRLFRQGVESQPLWITLIGFAIGLVVATFLRFLALSTGAIVKTVCGIVVAGAVAAFAFAAAANSVLGLVVAPFAAFFGLGMVGASLLVCRLIRQRPVAPPY